MRKYTLALIMTILLAVLPGCGKTANTELPVEESLKAETAETTAVVSVISGQKLKFIVTEAEQPGFTKEELGGKDDGFIVYFGLAEVNINIDGTDVSLAEAIRDGKLTVSEIFAFARLDAQNGFCNETYASEHGLTHFTYTYPECVLRLAYDVYETPDGRQTLIDEISVHRITDGTGSIGDTYVDTESEWGYFLDREDWGLTFQAANVSPMQIVLNYTQQGGQQIGELVIEAYTLYSMEGFGKPGLAGYIGSSPINSEGLAAPLLKDTSGQITIDWSATVGALVPGEYYLNLSISDIYDESEVHPLMENFYDKQSYNIVFSVE